MQGQSPYLSAVTASTACLDGDCHVPKAIGRKSNDNCQSGYQTGGKCQTLSMQEKIHNVEECQKNLRIRLQKASSHTQVASKDTISLFTSSQPRKEWFAIRKSHEHSTTSY